MSSTRWAALAAILFAVFLAASVILAGGPPDGNDPDQKWIDYYSDSGHQTMLLIAAYCASLSAIALIAFATVVFRSVSASPLPLLARGCAYVAATAFALGAVAQASVAAGAKFDSSPVDAASARYLQSLGLGSVLVVGALVAAAMIAAISALWLKEKTMPAWLAWFGFVCALALCAAIVWIPMVALPIWALVVGVVLLLRSADSLTASDTLAPQPAR